MVDVKIYRLEHDPQWASEVINEEGTSTVWETILHTDGEAYAAFQITVEEEGVRAFLDDDNVIQFPPMASRSHVTPGPVVFPGQRCTQFATKLSPRRKVTK